MKIFRSQKTWKKRKLGKWQRWSPDAFRSNRYAVRKNTKSRKCK